MQTFKAELQGRSLKSTQGNNNKSPVYNTRLVKTGQLWAT